MPPGPRALLDGERLLHQGRSEEAVRRLRDAVEFLPANAQAWNHLGLALHASRKPGDAVAAYEHALRLDRNLAAAHFNLGCLRLEQGNPPAAAESFRSFVGLQPRSAEGWVRLGQAQLRLRQWEPAENSFRSALRLQGGDSEALNGLGVSFQNRRRSREAWQCFTNALGRDPKYAPAWLNLAVIAHQAGARPHAVQAYRQYAALRPQAAQALGVQDLLRQLEEPPAPVIRLPPANPPQVAPAPLAAPTNRPTAPAPSPAPAGPGTNRMAAPVSTPRAASPPTPATNPPIASVPTPVQPRPPPTTPAVAGTGDSPPEPAAPPAPIASVVTPADRPSPVTTGEPSVEEPPTPASPVGPTNAVAAAPVPTPAVPGVATVPAVVPSTPPPAAAPAPEPAPAAPIPTSDESPLEVVRLDPDPNLAPEVKDEPWTGPLPAAPDARSSASSEPPPLVRPIAPRKPTSSADKRGFWDRANPLNWFDGDSEAAAGGPDAPRSDERDSSASAEDDSKVWRWARPGSWFRSGKSDTPATASEPGPASVARAPATTPAPVPPVAEPVPGVSLVRTSPPPVRVAAAPPARELPETPPPRELRRYNYRTQPPVVAGDVEAARALVAEGAQEHLRNRLDVAADRYEQALKVDPASFEAQQHLASARLQQGDLPKALAASEAALARRPDSAPTRLNFALALDRAGYPLDAAVEAEQVVLARPDDVSAHLLLGNLYAQKLDRPERAREHYLRVIELEPEHSQSIAIRRWLAGRRDAR